jgi:uncharacterized membrane protein
MAEAVPVFVPQPIRIRKIEIDRPWSWLAKGWQDLRATPAVGIGYGVLAAITSCLLTFGLIAMDMIYLLLPLAAGFLLVGPLLTVGLYETSRRNEQGLPTSLFDALLAFRRNALQIALMGVALMIFFFAWIRIATLLFFLYWGLEPPSVESLIVDTFLSPKGWPFLVIGTAIGGVLAFLAFSISVVSIPLLLDREDANVIEAIATSVRAVQANFGPLLLWAVLIAVFTVFGLVTAYLGLIVTLPLIGHASWHAYRDLVEFGAPGAA